MGHRRLPGRGPDQGQPLPLRPGEIPAGAAATVPGFPRMGGGGGQPLMAAAPAGVDIPLGLEPPEGRLIEGGTLPLAVGAVGPSHGVALVPVQAQPAQVLHQQLAPGRPGAVRVQVLHPQHQTGPGSPGVQPGQQKGKCVPQVHPPAGAGGKAALFRHGVSLPHVLQSTAYSVPQLEAGEKREERQTERGVIRLRAPGVSPMPFQRLS